jgi:hypothetical protein
MLYGKDWKKMQPLIKTRSLVQIRTHAQKVFKKIGLKKITGGVVKRRGGKDGEGDAELEDDVRASSFTSFPHLLFFSLMTWSILA